MKEKSLLKLEKDKLQKKQGDIQKRIKEMQDKVSKEIEESHKRQKMQQNKNASKKGKFTPFPEDARPNPYLAK